MNDRVQTVVATLRKNGILAVVEGGCVAIEACNKDRAAALTLDMGVPIIVAKKIVDDNPASLENASKRIIGELLELPEYRFVNQSLVAMVVRETVSRYIAIELGQED